MFLRRPIWTLLCTEATRSETARTKQHAPETLTTIHIHAHYMCTPVALEKRRSLPQTTFVPAALLGRHSTHCICTRKCQFGRPGAPGAFETFRGPRARGASGKQSSASRSNGDSVVENASLGENASKVATTRKLRDLTRRPGRSRWASSAISFMNRRTERGGGKQAGRGRARKEAKEQGRAES